MKPSPHAPPYPQQTGQALFEGLVVMLVLLSIWIAIAWISRFQDMGLQATHASRFAAFSLTRNTEARPIEEIRRRYFSGSAHQWADRRGRQLLNSNGTDVGLAVWRSTVLAAHEQPGGGSSDAQALRRDWLLEDAGIVSAHLVLTPRAPELQEAAGPSRFSMGLGSFDSWYPIVRRHTAILTGLGHASGDLDTQERVGRSDTGWNTSASQSYALGKHIQGRLTGIDKGWARPQPDFDWLGPWAGMVPGHHLKPYGAPQ